MSDIQAEAPLSIEAATALLGAEPEQHEEPAEGAQEVAAEAEPAEQEAAAEEGEAEASEEEGAEQEESEEEVEPEAPAIDAPPSWNAEDREVFAHLPREAQEVLARREAERDRALSRAQQQFAEAKKQVVADGQGLQALAQQVQGVVDTAKAAFERPIPDLLNAAGEPMTWEQVDWRAWFQSDPQSAATWKARYDYERGELERAQSAHQAAQEKAQAEALRARTEEQAEILSRIEPDLYADQKKRVEVFQYLHQQGVPEEHFAHVSAVELSLARKAMLYDRAQTAMKAPKPKASTPPPPPSKPVRPAAVAPASPKQQGAVVAKNRFVQTRTVADAVALLDSRG